MSERNMFDIFQDAKDGKPLDPEEMRQALIATDSILVFLLKLNKGIIEWPEKSKNDGLSPEESLTAVCGGVEIASMEVIDKLELSPVECQKKMREFQTEVVSSQPKQPDYSHN